VYSELASIPNLTLLVCLVENLLSSGEHMLETFVIDHTAGFIVAEGPGQNDLEHKLGGSAQWLLIRHFAE
jgi:hypothetical protein